MQGAMQEMQVTRARKILRKISKVWAAVIAGMALQNLYVLFDGEPRLGLFIAALFFMLLVTLVDVVLEQLLRRRQKTTAQSGEE